jgi:hypothetical protein
MGRTLDARPSATPDAPNCMAVGSLAHLGAAHLPHWNADLSTATDWAPSVLPCLPQAPNGALSVYLGGGGVACGKMRLGVKPSGALLSPSAQSRSG